MGNHPKGTRLKFYQNFSRVMAKDSYFDRMHPSPKEMHPTHGGLHPTLREMHPTFR